MIDRIHDNHYYSSNNNIGKKVNSNTETFSMDYSGRESVNKQELSREKENVAAKDALLHEEGADKGVLLELSPRKTESKTEVPQTQAEKMSDLIPERLKNLFRDIRAAFVRFFRGNAPAKEESADETGVFDETAASGEMSVSEYGSTDEADGVHLPTKIEHTFINDQNEQLNKSLSKAEEAYRAYAKMQEEKVLAKNSDLLTTYNRRGSFVKMNADDKNRILHAHPHQIDETF